MTAQSSRTPESTPAPVTPEMLGEALGNITLTRIARTEGFDEATALESKAASLRASTDKASRSAYVEATTLLVTAATEQVIPQRKILATQLELHANAPKTAVGRREYDADKILAIFDALKIGGPIITGLDYKDPAGLVASEPQIDIQHPADMKDRDIYSEISFTVDTTQPDGEVSIESVSTWIYYAPSNWVVGTEAIQAFADNLEFATHSERELRTHVTITNTRALTSAKEKIEALNAQGQNIDLTSLNAQVARAEAYDTSRRRQKYLTRPHPHYDPRNHPVR